MIASPVGHIFIGFAVNSMWRRIGWKGGSDEKMYRLAWLPAALGVVERGLYVLSLVTQHPEVHRFLDHDEGSWAMDPVEHRSGTRRRAKVERPRCLSHFLARQRSLHRLRVPWLSDVSLAAGGQSSCGFRCLNGHVQRDARLRLVAQVAVDPGRRLTFTSSRRSPLRSQRSCYDLACGLRG